MVIDIALAGQPGVFPLQKNPETRNADVLPSSITLLIN